MPGVVAVAVVHPNQGRLSLSSSLSFIIAIVIRHHCFVRCFRLPLLSSFVVVVHCCRSLFSLSSEMFMFVFISVVVCSL